MKFVPGVLALAALFAAGCSSTEEDKVEAVGETGGKDRGAVAGGKADCIDCSEDGPGAFQELGLGDAFWKVGQSWQVAYLMHTDTRAQHKAIEQVGQAKANSGLVVLDFEVVDVGEHASTVTRPTVIIRITQGTALGSVGELLAGREIRIDEVTAKIDLEIDDLFRPVALTEYSGPRGDFPNGRTIATDPREAVRSVGTSFPYLVPNAHLNAEKVSLPELPPELAEIADLTTQNYGDREYSHFDLDAAGYNAGEHVFWAAGDLWPYLVRTQTATGILIRQAK